MNKALLAILCVMLLLSSCSSKGDTDAIDSEFSSAYEERQTDDPSQNDPQESETESREWSGSDLLVEDGILKEVYSDAVNIFIPENVITVYSSAFSYCHELVSITVSADNPNYCSVDGVLYDKDMMALVHYPENRECLSYTLPDSVTTINGGFRSKNLTDLTLSKCFTDIPNSSPSFNGCINLKNIYVSDENPYFNSVDGVLFNKDKTAILSYPVARESNYYTIPEGVTEIGSGAFYGCANLTDIRIPDSVHTINIFAFYGCTSITSITIPDSVTSLHTGAFDYCTSLTHMTIPKSVVDICNTVFSGACNLQRIDVDENNTVYSSIDGVLFDKQQTRLIEFPASRDSSYSVPDGVIEIGEGSFSHCDRLTEIQFPDSLTAIEHDAFYDCKALKNVTIPDNIISLSSTAFDDNVVLTYKNRIYTAEELHEELS